MGPMASCTLRPLVSSRVRDAWIFFVNWLFRAGTSGDREREAEEAAREYFDRHGRWPNG